MPVMRGINSKNKNFHSKKSHFEAVKENNKSEKSIYLKNKFMAAYKSISISWLNLEGDRGGTTFFEDQKSENPIPSVLIDLGSGFLLIGLLDMTEFWPEVIPTPEYKICRQFKFISQI